MEKASSPIGDNELAALMVYWMAQQWPNRELWHNKVRRWAKLQLPNGQMARSVWYESSMSMKIRCTSCVEVCYPTLLLMTDYLHSCVDKVLQRVSRRKCTVLLLYAIWRPSVSAGNGPFVLLAR